MTTITNKQRRPRVSFGQVVASTNEVQNKCARTLTIIHVYNSLTYRRVRRYVLNT